MTQIIEDLDDTNAMAKAALPILKQWGLGNSRPLLKSAMNVARLRGKLTGEVVAALGLASQERIEELLAAKPARVKTLEYLRESGIRGINNHADEILSIQLGLCYVHDRFPELVVHPTVTKSDNAFFKRHQNELNKRGFLPMSCNGELVLIFSSFERAVQHQGMGKKECLDSTLITELAGWVKEPPERARFRQIVMRSSVYHAYLEELASGSADSGFDESKQVISHTEAAESTVMSKLVHIITEAIKLNVNDVSITPDYLTGGGVVEYRISQEMKPSAISLSRDEREQIVSTLVSRSRANTDAGRVRRPLDGNLSFTSPSGDAFIRLSFIPLEESRMPAVSVSLRILPKTTKPIILSELGIEPDVEEELKYLIQLRDGLFLVAGPTGSGKSTTIGGMLCEHNAIFGSTRKRLSVEQPVERILPGVKHIDVEQHSYGETKADKFALALRALLRHDPDVIFVGEVRDQASCMVTIDAANTGHQVYTTTHANDTVMAYRRLASFLPPERQYDLVNVLNGILAQRLVKLVCQHCSTVQDVTEEDRLRLERYSKQKGVCIKDKQFTTKRVVNRNEDNECQHCDGGISGMRGVHGLLMMTPEVRSLLLSSNEGDWMKAQEVGSKVTLFDSAYRVFEKGLIDLDELLL